MKQLYPLAALLTCTFFFIPHPLHSNSLHSNPLLDPEILQNKIKVQEILQTQGFKKVFFTTQDNMQLCGLFLDQSKIKKVKGTIIYCAGFYPGSKEGMSSFYTLLQNQPYNFLMFDARGHHESDGKLFSYAALKQYGSCEYQDIVAAINFLDTYNTNHNIAPSIIIHGICAGAFHAIKACNHLQENNGACNNIKGIIFDSGWLQVTDIVEPTICAELHKRLDHTWFWWLTKPLCYLTLQWYRLTLKHHHCKVTGIEQQIKNIGCPILFVHNIDDPYVPIYPIQKFVTESNCQNCWWIEHNSHADFHMGQPEMYTTKIMNFLEKI